MAGWRIGRERAAVKVQVTLRSGSHPLLQASVSAAGHQRLYLVDPQGGSLTVKADGVPEGQRKRWPRRPRRLGGMGTPSGSSGSNGSDGRSGFDGSPGGAEASR